MPTKKQRQIQVSVLFCSKIGDEAQNVSKPPREKLQQKISFCLSASKNDANLCKMLNQRSVFPVELTHNCKTIWSKSSKGEKSFPPDFNTQSS